jgi:hypothetical protein
MVGAAFGLRSPDAPITRSPDLYSGPRLSVLIRGKILLFPDLPTLAALGVSVPPW